MYHLDKLSLHKLYIEEQKSTYDIGKILNVHPDTVLYNLKKFNIPRRPKPFKGSHHSQHHAAKISQSLKGNQNGINPKTGKGYNWDRKIIICEYCNESIEVRNYEIKRGRKFHDRCHHEYLKTKVGDKNNNFGGGDVETRCCWDHCNKLVKRRRSLIKNDAKFFCCRQHYDFWRSKYQIGDKIYNYKGGPFDYNYGPGWNYTAEQIRKRDGYRCQSCSKTQDQEGQLLSVHHIIPFRLFGLENYALANKPENLITFCNGCHVTIENNLTNKYWNKEVFDKLNILEKFKQNIYNHYCNINFNPAKFTK